MDNVGTAPQPGRPWVGEDEIDLRQYLDVLIQWWREILAITLLTILVVAAALLVLSRLENEVYSAGAQVVIFRTITEVSFDERYRDVLDETASGQFTTADARRNALLTLVKSGSVARAVLAEIGDSLPEEQREPALLLDRIEASLPETGSVRGSDLISIAAQAGTPEEAAVLANAWAAAYVGEANRVFSQVPADAAQAIATQLAEADETFQTSQAAYEAFVADNRVPELTRQIAERERIINELQRAKDTAVTALINEAVRSQQRIIAAYLDAQTNNQLVTFEKEQAGQLTLITRYLDALNSAQISVFEEQVVSNLQQLQLYYDSALQTSIFLERAQTLRAQIAEGGEGAAQSSAAALQLLKTRLIASEVELPTITFDVADPEAQQPVITQLPAEGENQVIVNPPVAQTPSEMQPTAPPAAPATQLLAQLGTLENVSAEEMLADVDALVASLQTRAETLQTSIDALSQELLSGNGYAYLGETVPTESAIVQMIEESYPELTEPGLFASLIVSSTAESPLTLLTQERAAELLRLEGLEGIANYDTEGEQLTLAIGELESEVQALQAQLEAEQARELRLQLQRDRDSETFNTVSNKVAELQIEAVAANSEVRLASQAVPPIEPEPGFSLRLGLAAAGVMGLLLGVFVAFLASYLGQRPFFVRGGRAAAAA